MDHFYLTNLILWMFIASWIVSALWVNRTAERFSWRGHLPLYLAGAVFVIGLSVAAWAYPALWARLWPARPGFDTAMLMLQLAGIAWCWWARVYMGRLWSGGVVIKEGHRVVDSGPYAVVRHPIYSGAFLLVGAHVLVKARAVDLIFYAGLVAFFAAKARLEERFLLQELGDDYAAYRARVPMLMPRWRVLAAAFGR